MLTEPLRGLDKLYNGDRIIFPHAALPESHWYHIDNTLPQSNGIEKYELHYYSGLGRDYMIGWYSLKDLSAGERIIPDKPYDPSQQGDQEDDI